MLSGALGRLYREEEEEGGEKEEGGGREKRRGGGPSRPKAVLYIAKGDRIFLADSVELSVT